MEVGLCPDRGSDGAEPSNMIKRILVFLALNLLLCGLYYVAARVGLSSSFTFVNSSISAIWPPTGIAIAAVILLGYRVWPAILIGSFLVNKRIIGMGPGTDVTCLAIASGNTLEALLIAATVRLFANGAAAFERSRDVFRYILFSILATAISASVGVSALVLWNADNASRFRDMWLTWWLGDLASAILLAPLLIIWSRRSQRWTSARVFEGALLVAIVVGYGLLVFDGLAHAQIHNHPVEYIGVPLLLWAAFRFRQHGVITIAFIMSVLAIYGTLHGHGPFSQGDANNRLLFLQSFLCVMTLTALVLAAVVTERTRAHEALEGNEQRLLIALDAGRMGTWQWDIPTGKVAWSTSLEAIHGLEPGTFAGSFEAFLQRVHPDDREAVQRRIRGTLENKSDYQAEYRLNTGNRTMRWIESRGRLLLDRNGNPYRLVGVAVDISDRKRGEMERGELLEKERAARADAEKASRAKDTFLAVLSHELRTPLTPVLLTLSLLERRDDLPKEVRGDVDTIKRNVELEARLIDDLLDLTRISRGKLQLQYQVTDVHLLLSRAVEITYRDDGVNVKMELKAQRHHVRADPARLHQVFWNLLSNAHKFTPTGGWIHVRTRDVLPNGVVVEVTDSGAGIEAELLPKLFAAFEQGDAAMERRAGGLGLGLAISKALVEAHAGTLTATSAGKGYGATFTVSLGTVPAPVAPKEGTAPQPAGRAQALRVLLVEDHEQTQKIMARLLTKMGHQPAAAQSVRTALDLVARQKFDLVISDLGLPDGSGHELMRALRDRYGMRGIALSGYGMEEDVKRSHDAGFDQHLIKPVDLDRLEMAIRQVVASNGGR
jgi:PAS domain S-box-containing protein